MNENDSLPKTFKCFFYDKIGSSNTADKILFEQIGKDKKTIEGYIYYQHQSKNEPIGKNNAHNNSQYKRHKNREDVFFKYNDADRDSFYKLISVKERDDDERLVFVFEEFVTGEK